ncbi:PucR family transcriptional regulator [Bacillus sp. FJAT-44742]|uniref:PucR family transcriptional regulator n=1 Tax=Bacillus sp. FJAT-44742 TaxID=2014005 RepID=UPI000C247821|nr:PucR family transcriptional regulator [Bacillus sp. FJAT-44742]
MDIKGVMDLPLFREAQMLAGQSGNHREVCHVNMMDAPDINDYLKNGDLLVTTAYHFKDEPSRLLDLIRHMASCECAGLGIKTQRFLHEIPKEVLSLADELSFPIIDLPIDVSLGSIVNQILSTILNYRTTELNDAIEAQHQFTAHIMGGKDLKSLLGRVSSIIKQPIILLDQHSKLISSSHEPSTLIETIKTMYIQNFDFLLPANSFSCFSMISEEHHTEMVSVFPVYTHARKCGYLLILGEELLNNQGMALTIEQAANVISFELMKENALKQYEQRARNEFFSNFVEGVFSSKEEIINRSKEFHLQNAKKYICIVGKLDRDEKAISFTQYQMETDTAYEYLEGELAAFSFQTHFFIKGNTCVILLEVNDYSQETSASALSTLQTIQQGVQKQFQRTLSFGVSNISHQFIEVKEAYDEAADALQTGQLSGKANFIQTYQTKDITELLRMIPTDDLRKFYDYTLQKLSEPEYKDQGLLHTLSVYLETHCQISETAKRLYIHRNTVIYRLEKCEELLGKSLKDPDTSLRLRLALRIQTSLNL